MAWIDGILVLAIFGSFGFVIYVKLREKDSPVIKFIEGIFSEPMYKKIEPEILTATEERNQIWNEHRSML